VISTCTDQSSSLFQLLLDCGPVLFQAAQALPDIISVIIVISPQFQSLRVFKNRISNPHSRDLHAAIEYSRIFGAEASMYEAISSSGTNAHLNCTALHTHAHRTVEWVCPTCRFLCLFARTARPGRTNKCTCHKPPHHITTHALQGVVTHDDIIVIIDGEAGAAAAVAINK
jgi:hypothetical protein